MSDSFLLTHSLKGFGIVIVLASSVSIAPKTALAGCNFYGCSQSSVAECNFHGCPNPPMGAECNFHGCPPSPQPAAPSQNNSTPPNTVIVVPTNTGQGQPSNANTGGSGQAIADCMQRLLYNSFGNRTAISESTAVQACRNAR